MSKQGKQLAIGSICFLASLGIGQVYACNEDECSTSTCGCKINSCTPYGHAGSYCTTNGHNCDLHGNCAYSCNQWCTTYSSTCAPASGQLGSSECGTI